MTNELSVIPPGELVRQSTDIAGLCRDIVLKTAIQIQGRKYVKVEGWQSIATAHGCVASCRDVERVAGGFRAIGEIRRISNGQVLATAEGFVGEDEPTWFGGATAQGKTLPKRPDYAIRAMCQTRAISRACRSCFAHVVVLMDAGLSTTPAEEVPEDGFDDVRPHTKPTPAKPVSAPKQAPAAQPTGNREELLAELRNKIPSDLVPWAVAYLRDFTDSKGVARSWLTPVEGLDGLNPGNLKAILHNWDVFQTKLEEFIRLNDNPEVAPLGKPVPAPAEFKIEKPDEPWRNLVVPFGKDKGVKFGDLEKGKLWFWVMAWEPKPWEKDGKTYPPKKSDVEFHKLIGEWRDEIAKRYEFKPPTD